MANQDLHSLKYVVDTVGSDDSTVVHSALRNHVNPYNIDQSVWLQALHYAEHRIEVIEPELLDNADRVLELVDIMPNQRGSEAATRAAEAKSMGKRAKLSESLQAAPIGDIADELENLRENLKRFVLRWLKEARQLDLFR
ncbi:hypothetical protein LTR85_010721 [Meristemomyces frigidus]|nr:hypothetical protein LTR85_010721 [Meristemomyces frigidus]